MSILSITSVAIFVTTINSSFAQSKEEHHAYEHHAKVLEHAAALKDGTDMSKKDMKDHAK